MKFFSALSVAAVALVSAVQGSLTPYDNTYDLMAVYVRRNLLAVTRVVFDENNSQVVDAFRGFVFDVETATNDGKISFDAYRLRRKKFLKDVAETVDDAYADSLKGKIVAREEQITESSVVYAPMNALDINFEALETVTSTLKDQDALENIKNYREFIETNQYHLSPIWQAVTLADEVNKMGEKAGKDYAGAIDNLMKSLTESMEEKYGDSDLSKF